MGLIHQAILTSCKIKVCTNANSKPETIYLAISIIVFLLVCWDSLIQHIQFFLMDVFDNSNHVQLAKIRG